MEERISAIAIDKNRGWRGLARLSCLDKDYKEVNSMVFSFSQPMWEDMLSGYIVMQDNEYYYVINFGSTRALPRGQRSVLIKHFAAPVTYIYKYPKATWAEKSLLADPAHHKYIYNFIKNRNNHTTSDWNYIGIRVIPTI